MWCLFVFIGTAWCPMEACGSTTVAQTSQNRCWSRRSTSYQMGSLLSGWARRTFISSSGFSSKMAHQRHKLLFFSVMDLAIMDHMTMHTLGNCRIHYSLLLPSSIEDLELTTEGNLSQTYLVDFSFIYFFKWYSHCPTAEHQPRPSTPQRGWGMLDFSSWAPWRMFWKYCLQFYQ